MDQWWSWRCDSAYCHQRSTTFCQRLGNHNGIPSIFNQVLYWSPAQFIYYITLVCCYHCCAKLDCPMWSSFLTWETGHWKTTSRTRCQSSDGVAQRNKLTSPCPHGTRRKIHVTRFTESVKTFRNSFGSFSVSITSKRTFD